MLCLQLSQQRPGFYHHFCAPWWSCGLTGPYWPQCLVGPCALLVLTQSDPSAGLGEVGLEWRCLESRGCSIFEHLSFLVTLQTWGNNLQNVLLEFWRLRLLLWPVNFIVTSYLSFSQVQQKGAGIAVRVWNVFPVELCCYFQHWSFLCVKQTSKLSEIKPLIFTEQWEPLLEVLKLWWRDMGAGTLFGWGELMLMIQISLPSRITTLFWAMTVEYITCKCLSRLHWTELNRWKLWSMTGSLFLSEKWLHLEHCSWRGVGWWLAVLLDSSWDLSASHWKRSQMKH